MLLREKLPAKWQSPYPVKGKEILRYDAPFFNTFRQRLGGSPGLPLPPRGVAAPASNRYFAAAVM